MKAVVLACILAVLGSSTSALAQPQREERIPTSAFLFEALSKTDLLKRIRATLVPELRPYLLFRTCPDCWLISSQGELDFADTRSELEDLAREDRFSSIVRRFRRNKQDVVIWSGLGWITWTEAGPIYGKGECDPSQIWRDKSGNELKHCVERPRDDEFTIKMKAAHPGFTVYGFGVGRGIKSAPPDTKEKMIRELVSDDYARQLADKVFIAVAVDAVRAKRSITFQLYMPGDAKPSKETSDAVPAAPPPPASSDSDRTYNSCGGTQNASSACPPFFKPDERNAFENMVRRLR